MAAHDGTSLVGLVHGQCVAGPLAISAGDEPGLVHIGFPNGGVWLTERQVGKLVAALERAAQWPVTFEYGEEE